MSDGGAYDNWVKILLFYSSVKSLSHFIINRFLNFEGTLFLPLRIGPVI